MRTDAWHLESVTRECLPLRVVPLPWSFGEWRFQSDGWSEPHLRRKNKAFKRWHQFCLNGSFGQKSVRATLQRFSGNQAIGRYQDYRQGETELAHGFDEEESMNFGHEKVDDDQVGWLAQDEIEGGERVQKAERMTTKAVCAQQSFDRRNPARLASDHHSFQRPNHGEIRGLCG